MRLIVLFLLTVTIMSVIESDAAPSFYDNIPGIAQAKIALLYLIGKREQAIDAAINFTNLTHLLENVENIDDSIPGYGYVKAVVSEITGDHERAVEIFESAQRSAFTIFGCMIFASPIGGIAGLLAADLTSSIFESKSVGVLNHAFHIGNKTASENIDLVLDLAFAATTSSDIKLSVNSAPHNKYSIHLKMKEIGHPLLKKNPHSITSQLAHHGKKIFVQPYTPMDHHKIESN